MIEPYTVFKNGVTEHDFLDSLDGKDHPYQLCWSLIYRKLRANRGCTMIMPHEYADLLDKLKNNNDSRPIEGTRFSFDASTLNIVPINTFHNYEGQQNTIDILPRLIYKYHHNNKFEAHLQSYILKHFHDSSIKRLFNIDDIEQVWVGNEVSCGVGMQRIDILTIEKKGKNTHITIIELKSGTPHNSIVENQLLWYIQWVLDYVAPNYTDKSEKIFLQPCIIAKTFKRKKQKKEFIDNLKSRHFSKPKGQSPRIAEICPTKYISFDINHDIIFTNEV